MKDDDFPVPEWAKEYEEQRAKREAFRKKENAEFYRTMNRFITYFAIGFCMLYLLLVAVLFWR